MKTLSQLVLRKNIFEGITLTFLKCNGNLNTWIQIRIEQIKIMCGFRSAILARNVSEF
jgi:hypothetical protein